MALDSKQAGTEIKQRIAMMLHEWATVGDEWSALPLARSITFEVVAGYGFDDTEAKETQC